jgi:SEC-C motif
MMDSIPINYPHPYQCSKMKKGKRNKLGRNDPCPCGSGKKYKMCCLPKGITFIKNMPNKKSFFDQFDKVDLLKSFAGLQVHPQNHGKNVRLELLVQEVFKSPASYGKKIVYSNGIKNYLNKYYSSHHLEDNPVNLFTESITFDGGDYIIFPGITEGTSFVLSNLLNAIFYFPNSKVPKDFKYLIHKASLFLLSISNTIAKHLGYSRNIKEEIIKDQIELPPNADLEPLKRSILFSQDDIDSIRKKFSIPEEVVSQFLANEEDIANSNGDENPLINKPLVLMRGDYLVLSPTTISFALTSFIWEMAEIVDCMKEVNDVYHDVVWQNTRANLNICGFRATKPKDFPEQEELAIKEALFQIDDDKLAYVVYQYDDGSGYSENPYMSINMEITDKIEARKQKIIDYLLAKKELQGFSIFNLNIYSGIGRDMSILSGDLNNAVTLGIPTNELDIIVKTGERDRLGLWNFALINQRGVFDGINFSTLDRYAIYKDHQDSLYISDESRPTKLFVTPGYSAELIKKAILELDAHSARKIRAGKEVWVPVWKRDNYAPIYLTPGNLDQMENYVAGFPQAIWVEPEVDMNTVPSNAIRMYKEMNDAIAYWLWQVCDNLTPLLNEMDDLPITFLFDFEEPEKFADIKLKNKKDPNLFDKFKSTVNNNQISISIPSELVDYLYSSDNEGERILLKFLLVNINELLNQRGFIKILSEEEITEIIEEKAPLGQKKKVFILDSNKDLRLDPRNLKKPRYLKDYNTGVILDSLVPGLGKKCPPIGSLEKKEDKEKLTKNLVMSVLLPKLKQSASDYNSTELLRRLIGMYESLVQKRENLKFLTPTRIACFTGVEQHTHDINKQLIKLERSTLAIRCLIEHVASEQFVGAKKMSQGAIDELVAIMDQAISWGMLGDQIHYGLFDIEMSILSSRRVGTVKDLSKAYFDPYRLSRSKETVTDAVGNFDSLFKSTEDEKGDSKITESLDNAFKEQYGVSVTDVIEFCHLLTGIGLNTPTKKPFAEYKKSELKEKINSLFKEEMLDDKLEALLSYSSLENRTNVENVPTGFDRNDISPWRYNRGLSLTRKPLIKIENSENSDDPTYLWGARHVMDAGMYLLNLIFSGKLRTGEGTKLDSVIGKFANNKGKAFREAVSSTCSKLENIVLDAEVEINKKSDLYSEDNLGDVDVLLINEGQKTIYSLECKNMVAGKNVKEMIGEVGKLLGSDSSKGWIEKHQRRHDWLLANTDKLEAKYGLDFSDYQVKSIFITPESLSSSFIKENDLKMPFITYYELEKEGLNVLLNCKI